MNSFVRVSRTALNQRRQPAVCTQRSAYGPAGLSRKNRYRAHSSSSSASGSAGYGTWAWPPYENSGSSRSPHQGQVISSTADPQCATAAAPCSSMRAPVVKRSSVYGALSSCGAPVAIVCASTQPTAGVALKPPVPHPQFT